VVLELTTSVGYANFVSFCMYVGLIPAFAKTSTGQSDIVKTLS